MELPSPPVTVIDATGDALEQDPIAAIEGRDPQLERAVAGVLRLMEENPKRLSERPAPPVRVPGVEVTEGDGRWRARLRGRVDTGRLHELGARAALPLYFEA